MKNVFVKSALSLLLSSSILIGGSIGVLADEQTPDGSEAIEVEGDTVSEDALYGSTDKKVALNSTNFPDATFRDILRDTDYDTNGDGYLSETEIDGIKRLYLSYKDISSLKGIEYLTNLCELNISGNKISSVDLSANPGLKRAYETGETTVFGSYTKYECYNEAWAHPLRTLTVDNTTKVTFSSGLGWKQNSSGWWFKNADGSYPNDCLKHLGGFLFCFDKNGYIVTNTWKEIDGTWYYFDKEGEAFSDWHNINGKWYFFGINHDLWTGNYIVIHNWEIIKDIQTTTVYYVNDDGVMQTGWQLINGEWRYFNNSGEMQTGWVNVSGKWYYFEEDQSEAKNPRVATMITGWKEINGTWYYFKSSGAMAENEYCEGYWLGKDGAWTYKHKASWKKDSTGWWFGDSTGWYAKNETLTINGKSYNFNSAGYCTNP